MPNYVDNILFLEGNQNQISKILSYQFSFSNTVPLEDLSDENCLKNWGVRNDAVNPITDNSSTIFLTPYGEPDIWFKKTVEKYPEISMKLFWFQGSTCLEAGMLLSQNGTLIREVYGDKEAGEIGKKYFGYTDDFFV